MIKRERFQSFGGSLEIVSDDLRGIFVLKPRGFIHPSLIKKDLEQAEIFGQLVQRPWIYLVDTSDVIFANPLNLIYLKRVKQLPYIQFFYIIAPNPFIRLLQFCFAPVLKIDKVFKSSKELDFDLDIS